MRRTCSSVVAPRPCGAALEGFQGRSRRRVQRTSPAQLGAWGGRGEREEGAAVDGPGGRSRGAEGLETTPNDEVNVGGVGDGDDVVIEFRDVWKSFGTKAVLRGASFTIKRGEAIGIIGPSGTGKSTALRLISGLVSPDKGDILVDGRSSLEKGRRSSNGNGSAGEQQKTRINLQLGLVFQNGALFDSLTVAENVGFRLYEHSSLKESEIRERVEDSLAKVGLQGIEDRYPSELSGGMRKRVALARAITSDGSGVSSDGDEVEELIMYDEPTAGLDPVASTVVEDLIRSLKDKGGVRTYIVVTHQASTIARSVDRIIFLHEGKVVWHGDQQEFKTTEEAIVRQFRSGSLSGPISYV